MSGQSGTVTVPQPLVDRLKQQADQAERSIEDELVLALATVLPLEASLPADLAARLASFVFLDDATLWDLARGRVADEDAERLAELGDKRQRAGLSPDELGEAEYLAQRHDWVLAVRAEAAALLKSRGDEERVRSEATR